MKERILIADDEEVVRINIQEFLQAEGYTVDAAADGIEALERIGQGDYALVITDIRMPGLDGIELLERVAAECPETFVLVMTAYASIDTAVESLRLGAYDYLLKPVVFEDLLRRVQNLFEYRALREEVTRLRRHLSSRLGFEGMVGDSPRMRLVYGLIEKVAPTDATVLIVGESGTGKELVARAIHARSSVSEREFIPVNMAALPRDTVEAQLFGHEKGAFTGADRAHDGLLRSVREGTIFLDEVGELPLSAQAKLLRAVESREVLPVGARRPVPTAFRLVAATNRDLSAALEARAFREDLYYRLNVFRIELPPLRERREDIADLVAHFLRIHARAQSKDPLRPTNRAMKALLGYSWPGNVRELSNVIERACILSEGDHLDVAELPSEFERNESLPMALKGAVEGFERRHIEWVLRAVAGNREQAARMLEIDPATLYRRLAKYDLRDE
ncbi:MAG: sigma-54 dependent transcriptional regulator [Acidobacteriota bacterium]|nr:sigma-54 dependent transcriptional regulator [Acidobacteriota bacterium]